ncbi:MAG: HPr family phosphocarrier protein [bacterium]
MTRRETRIVNRLGLHARAAAQLVRMANEYNSDISLIKPNQQANAKTIMEVLMLGATQGEDLTVEARGDDEERAVEAIVQLIDARFNELE